jgi:hypothetical protein
MRQFSTSKFMITLNYVLYMVFVFVFYIIELVNMGDLLLIRRYGNKWKKNGEWKEGVQMRRVVIKVNVGYLGDQNVFWRLSQSVTLPSPSLHVCVWRAVHHSHLYNMVRSLASCCAAFSPHSHTTTSCASLLVSHPHLFHISTTSTTTLLFFSRWNINLLTLKLYYLSTCI